MELTQEQELAARGKRDAALLERYLAGKHLTRSQIDELRRAFNGRLPGEAPEPELERAPVPPPSRPRYIVPPLPKIRPQDDPTVKPWLLGLMSRAFRPRPKISIGKWAEENHLKIPADESHGMPGDYRESTEPVATVIHRFLQDPAYKIFIGPKPSRMGYTLAAFVAICYYIKHLPGNIIFCMDVKGKAERTTRLRIAEMIKGMGTLQEMIPKDQKAFQRSVIYLNGMTLAIAGAKSISDVTSDTALLVVGDEVDQYREFKGGEASAFKHLNDRVMDVPGGKAVFFGKPRNENDILWTQMMTGTRHQCFVPCPHCSHYQPLLFENMFFDHCKDAKTGIYDLGRVERETFFRCINPACRSQPHGGIILETSKRWMVERHVWKQTYFGDNPDYPFDPKKFSILPAGQAYSLRPELTWGALAKDFLVARTEGMMSLAHYFRTRWGQARNLGDAITKLEEVRALQHYTTAEHCRLWWESGERTDFSRITRQPYGHGQCPWVPDDVVMFVDCQTESGEKKYVKMAARVMAPGVVETAVVDYGIVLSFSQLLPIADAPVEVVAWNGEEPRDICVSSVWIDEGGTERNEIAVRKFCAREDTLGRFFPSKGAGGGQIEDTVSERTRTVHTDDAGEMEITAYHFNHDSFATAFVCERVKKHDQILLALAQGLDLGELGLPGPLWLPSFCDDAFLKELTCLVLKKKRVKGRTVEVWEKTGDRVNDFQDGVQGCLAMIYFNSPAFAALSPPPAAAPAPEPDRRTKRREYLLRRTAR